MSFLVFWDALLGLEHRWPPSLQEAEKPAGKHHGNTEEDQ